MNSTLDLALVTATVLAAIAFLARGFFGRKKKGCSTGGGCGASKKPKLPPLA